MATKHRQQRSPFDYAIRDTIRSADGSKTDDTDRVVAIRFNFLTALFLKKSLNTAFSLLYVSYLYHFLLFILECCYPHNLILIEVEIDLTYLQEVGWLDF